MVHINIALLYVQYFSDRQSIDMLFKSLKHISHKHIKIIVKLFLNNRIPIHDFKRFVSQVDNKYYISILEDIANYLIEHEKIMKSKAIFQSEIKLERLHYWAYNFIQLLLKSNPNDIESHKTLLFIEVLQKPLFVNSFKLKVNDIILFLLRLSTDSHRYIWILLSNIICIYRNTYTPLQEYININLIKRSLVNILDLVETMKDIHNLSCVGFVFVTILSLYNKPLINVPEILKIKLQLIRNIHFHYFHLDNYNLWIRDVDTALSLFKE